MATEELANLIRKRGYLKSKLTYFKKYLDEWNSSKGYRPLHLKLQQLENSYKQFDEIQTNILCFDDSNTQIQEGINFEEAYFELIEKATQRLDSDPSSPIHRTQETFPLSAKTTSVALPKIQLNKFSGTLEDWLSFKDLFLSVIHNNQTLSGVNKLYYLRSVLEGEAYELIKSLALTEQNYDVAWQILEKRYSIKPVLVNHLVHKMFTLPSLTKESSTELKKLVDNVQQSVKSLQNLGLPVAHWDTILVYVVVSKLDLTTRREWELTRDSIELPTYDELLEFLMNRSRVLDTLHSSKTKEYKQTTKLQTKKQSKYTSNAAFVTSRQQCSICQQSHNLYQCSKFLNMNTDKRYQHVKENKLCFNCLRSSHRVQQCKGSHCRKCNRYHNTLLHRTTNKVQVQTQPESKDDDDKQPNVSMTYISREVRYQHILLSTAVILVADDSGLWHTCRALLDQGSQSNFMTEQFSEKLKLKTQDINIPIISINGAQSVVRHKTQIKMKSRVSSSYENKLSCLIIPNITGLVPSVELDMKKCRIPPNIELADPNFEIPSQVDMLLGAEIFWEVLENGCITLGKESPTLRATCLGWICTGMMRTLGKLNQRYECQLNISDSLTEQLQQFFETEDISTHDNKTFEDVECEKLYQQSISRTSKGRYIVTLPRKEGVEPLGQSKQIAMQRMYALEHRLERQPLLKTAYHEFMREYENMGHMSLVNNESTLNTQEHYYIPHFCIKRPQSTTTPIRIVFNASQVTQNGPSLNETLLKGPQIQESLFSILARFRYHKYVINADIEKMYRMINVIPEQRPLQRILWRYDRTKPIRIYELNTVTYGLTSSPFLATRTIHQLFQDECYRFSPELPNVERSFYMDDVLYSGNDKNKISRMTKELNQLMELGGFHLRKWSSNCEDILKDIPDVDKATGNIKQFGKGIVNTLGMQWKVPSDELNYKINIDSNSKTKRQILSTIAQIFDPLGLIAAVIVPAKHLMQKLWQNQFSWDQQLPQAILWEWENLQSELAQIATINIPRCITDCTNRELIKSQLHIFTDASQIAYAANAYLRCEYDDGSISSNLVAAKTRIAPTKAITIPKLELNGAVLGTQLANSLYSVFSDSIQKIVMWSDSTIILSWIHKPRTTLPIYVANRVKKIQASSYCADWRYVASTVNPADIGSRGTVPSKLIQSSLWWFGPHWLRNLETEWPDAPVDSIHEVPITQVNISQRNDYNELWERYSSITKLVRVLAYCKRFSHNCRNMKQNRKIGSLTLEELDQSWSVVIRRVQQEAFPIEFKQLQEGKVLAKHSNIIKLNPFIDNEGLIRVGGRLTHSELSFSRKHPIILPSKHNITRKIIRYEHEKQFHTGPQNLLNILRERFWILKGRKTVQSELQKCVTCFKVKPKLAQQLMGSLPKDRVSPYRPFECTGVDYCGPLMIRHGSTRNKVLRKIYVALFICFATKAVHIELVHDLTTSAFLDAFKRFISRRGKCSIIYSDNATTFVGARNQFRELQNLLHSEKHRSQIQLYAAQEHIDWKWIVPRAAHQGGLWESAIKQMKYHLRRVIGSTSFTYEQLNTLVIQVEACMNSRPLTPLSEEPDSLEVLTPAHFLIGTSMRAMPDKQYIGIPQNRLNLWEKIQLLYQTFWKRWQREIITNMQVRTKWHKLVNEDLYNKLVLIKDEKLPPLVWKMGRIIEVHRGQDNLPRSVTMKTKNGQLKRAIQHVAILPIDFLGREDVGSPIQKEVGNNVLSSNIHW